MDSRTFFDYIRKSWVGKQGVYVIENELFSKHLGKPIYKIGYARYDMASRIGDYRTAYSHFIPFKIHYIYEVPEKVGGQRANFALLTEQRIHNTLKKMGKWSGEGEWFYDIDAIANVISSIRLEHLQKVEASKKWTYYTTHISKKVIEVDSEKNVSSKLNGLIVLTQEERERRFNRGQAKPDYRETHTRITHRKKPVVPTSFIDEEGNDTQ